MMCALCLALAVLDREVPAPLGQQVNRLGTANTTSVQQSHSMVLAVRITHSPGVRALFFEVPEEGDGRTPVARVVRPIASIVDGLRSRGHKKVTSPSRRPYSTQSPTLRRCACPCHRT